MKWQIRTGGGIGTTKVDDNLIPIKAELLDKVVRRTQTAPNSFSVGANSSTNLDSIIVLQWTHWSSLASL